jgi:hypothetical protein
MLYLAYLLLSNKDSVRQTSLYLFISLSFLNEGQTALRRPANRYARCYTERTIRIDSSQAIPFGRRRVGLKSTNRTNFSARQGLTNIISYGIVRKTIS